MFFTIIALRREKVCNRVRPAKTVFETFPSPIFCFHAGTGGCPNLADSRDIRSRLIFRKTLI